MIIIQFLFFGTIVVFGAVSLSKQAEIIDENTKINPAIIGIIIALATSLPELATSVTSVFLGTPSMAIGNVLGSNVFNSLILGLVAIYFFKEKLYSNINVATNKINYYVLLMYLLCTIGFIFDSIPMFWNVSLISILIFLTYIISIKRVESEQSKYEVKVEHDHSQEKAKRAYNLFVLFAIVILVSSILLSLTADQIVEKTGLSASFVGALFVAISTSLPEVITCASLVKSKSYNMATTSIVGSNLFNFLIIAIVDILITDSIYSMFDITLGFLVVFGIIFTIINIMFTKIKSDKTIISIIPGIIMFSMYMIFIFTGR